MPRHSHVVADAHERARNGRITRGCKSESAIEVAIVVDQPAGIETGVAGAHERAKFRLRRRRHHRGIHNELLVQRAIAYS